MSSLSERERAFESHFVHQQDLDFQIQAKADRSVGEWAAQLLNKTSEETELYVQDLIRQDIHAAAHRDMFEKLITDLEGLADWGAIQSQYDQAIQNAKAS